MRQQAVIDLGDRSAPPEPVAPAVRHWRPVAAAAGVLLLGLLGGAAPTPPPETPITLPTALGDVVSPDGDLLHVVSPGFGAAGQADVDRTLRSYRLPAVEPVADVPVRIPGSVQFVRRTGAALLITVQVGAEPMVAAVDAATGRTLWSRTGFDLGSSPSGRTVVLVQPGDGDPQWQGVDLGTGEVRWEQPDVRPGRAQLVGEPGDGRLLVTAVRGSAEIRDLDTGVVIARAELPAPETPPGLPHGMWACDDLLLLFGADEISAYGLDGLELRWRTPLDAAGGHLWPDCSQRRLHLVDRGNMVTALDPATGRVRWRTGPWLMRGTAGERLLVTAGDRPDPDAPLVVLDAQTGRPAARFGRWEPAGQPGPDGQFVATRLDLATRTMWYARLDPATGAERVLGTGSGVTGDCWATAGVLGCRLQDATLALWRLP